MVSDMKILLEIKFLKDGIKICLLNTRTSKHVTVAHLEAAENIFLISFIVIVFVFSLRKM